MRSAERSVALGRFQRGQLDPGRLTHREHVRIAFEMLGRYEFLDAAARYTRGLRRVCARAGRPEKFHLTVTVAFLSLIAERRAEQPFGDFAAFAAANPDVLERSVLSRWYSPQRLDSAAARGTFLLPDLR